MRDRLIVLGICLVVTGCGDMQGLTPSSAGVSITNYLQTRDVWWLGQAIEGALGKRPPPVRVYYSSGQCDSDELTVGLPALDLNPDLPSEAGVGAVRALFARQPNVKISQDAAGIVRIRIGDISDIPLKARVGAVHIDPHETGDAELVTLDVITSESAAKQTGYRTPIHFLAARPSPPSPGSRLVLRASLVDPTSGPMNRYFDGAVFADRDKPVLIPAYIVTPCLPGSPCLKSIPGNITLDRALDLVATTFGGVLLYGACDRERVYDARYV